VRVAREWRFLAGRPLLGARKKIFIRKRFPSRRPWLVKTWPLSVALGLIIREVLGPVIFFGPDILRVFVGLLSAYRHMSLRNLQFDYGVCLPHPYQIIIH
jgi:hypothetical protein